MAFRIASVGSLSPGDQILIKLDGNERFSWTATYGDLELKRIPMPSFQLHSGSNTIDWIFRRPSISLKKEMVPNSIIRLEVSHVRSGSKF